MAAKSNNLSFSEIVLGADRETIQRALEARQQIDGLLEERAQAYEQIARLEAQVSEIMDGDDYPFPEPESPVSGFGGKSGGAKKVAKKKAPAVAVERPAPKQPEATTPPQVSGAADA